MALFENIFGNRKGEKKGPLGMPLGPVRKALSERQLLIEHPRIFPDKHPMMSPAGAGEIQGFIFTRKPKIKRKVVATEDWKKLELKWRKIRKDVGPRIREVLPTGAELWEEPKKGQPPTWFVKAKEKGEIGWTLSAVGIWPEPEVYQWGLPAYTFSWAPEFRSLARKVNDVIQDYYDELEVKIKRGEKIF